MDHFIDEFYPSWTCGDLNELNTQWTTITNELNTSSPVLSKPSICISKGSFGIAIVHIFLGKVMDITNESKKIYNVELEAFNSVMNTRDVLLMDNVNQLAIQNAVAQLLQILANEYDAYEEQLKNKLFTKANEIRTYIDNDNPLDHRILPLLDLGDWLFKPQVNINDVYDAIDRAQNAIQRHNALTN